MRFRILSVCLVLIAFAPSLGFADHISKSQEVEIDDGKIKSKSFKTDVKITNFVKIYKSIGGNTKLIGKRKKRKWWCGWLCKRPVGINADEIVIENTYYGKVSPAHFETLDRRKVCRSTSSCTEKITFWGFLTKMKFPGDLGEIEVVGVTTRHTINVNGETKTWLTAKGEHPDFEIPPVQ